MEVEVGATTKGWDDIWRGVAKVDGHVRNSLLNKREPGQAYVDGALHHVRKKLKKQRALHVPLRCESCWMRVAHTIVRASRGGIFAL